MPRYCPVPVRRAVEDRPLAQPEVRQVHVIGAARPRIDQHVGRLDVAVDQPGRVRGVQRRRHRRDDRRGPGGRQRALPLQKIPDAAAGHVAHRDEQHPVGLARLVHRDDVRVVDRGGRPGLPEEPAPEGLVGGQPGARILSATSRPSRSSRPGTPPPSRPRRSVPPGGTRRPGSPRRAQVTRPPVTPGRPSPTVPPAFAPRPVPVPPSQVSGSARPGRNLGPSARSR